MIYDYLIIGAGIPGAAVAFELSAHGTVVIIEAESMSGYHSTGRSAALYTPNYGGPIVRRINQVSKSLFENPPAGFCNTPLLTPRGQLTVALPGDTEKLTPILQRSIPEAPIERLTASLITAGILPTDMLSMGEGKQDISPCRYVKDTSNFL
jgi:D-arginine dehydrogenase